MTLPRGIRNKNPGNIRLAPHFDWKGELMLDQNDPQYDEAFCVFEDPLWGLRAMMKLLINYNQRHIDKDGNPIKTLAQAIGRWAPPNENDVEAYVRFVSSSADIRAQDEWDFTQRMFLVPVAKAMVIHENGWPSAAQIESGVHEYWYSNKVYEEAYQMAVTGRITSHTMNEVPLKKEEIHLKTRNRWLINVLSRLISFLKGA